MYWDSNLWSFFVILKQTEIFLRKLDLTGTTTLSDLVLTIVSSVRYRVYPGEGLSVTFLSLF